MGLEDINGKPIDLKSKPKLDTLLAVFEGEADFKFYRDAVEYAGQCLNCGNIVAGLLRLRDPRMHQKVRTLEQEQALKGMCAEVMKQRHRCNFAHDGKDTVDDLLKRLRLPS